VVAGKVLIAMPGADNQESTRGPSGAL
jgi:hypothetical protein